MIKKYKIVYNTYDAEAHFTVDTEKFTNEHAKATLDFFLWSYDKEADPIEEVVKKYAMEAIKIATFENYNLLCVINCFNNLEGYCKVDGSNGIELTYIEQYEFVEDYLDLEEVVDEK